MTVFPPANVSTERPVTTQFNSMWDFSSVRTTVPPLSQDGTRRRNSLKQLFRGNTTALERSNWASKTGENHAIDDHSRNFLGIEHAESHEAFTAASDEEKRLLRKPGLTPSALVELQSLPYKSVAEQLGCSATINNNSDNISDANQPGDDVIVDDFMRLRKTIGDNKKGKHALLQPPKDSGGWFGSFTSGSVLGSTEANGNIVTKEDEVRCRDTLFSLLSHSLLPLNCRYLSFI